MAFVGLEQVRAVPSWGIIRLDWYRWRLTRAGVGTEQKWGGRRQLHPQRLCPVVGEARGGQNWGLPCQLAAQGPSSCWLPSWPVLGKGSHCGECDGEQSAVPQRKGLAQSMVQRICAGSNLDYVSPRNKALICFMPVNMRFMFNSE